ncbi:MAG: hypothetical protein KGI37_10675 [Alphaproteobacteria bacterium]|nr:hypothetical protein [Alphaproteobacteria bacterium]
MESGKEQNYWPAFVDALSNVVLTLVFVLIIFVFALVIESQKVEQKMEEVTQAAAAQKTGQGSEEQENAELKKQLAALTTELQKFRGQASASDQQSTGAVEQQAVSTQNQNKQIKVEDKDVDKTNAGPVQIVHAQNSVVLSYPLSVAQMDQKSEDQLGHVLDAMEKTTGKHKVIVHSILGRETYSVARRMAYYRAIGARNYLIQKMGEAPDNISISIVTPPQPEDGRVEILLQKE